ncbi:MAG: pyridoxamine 5'-phosphate oxidase [Pseudomonadota bacterium]
MADKLIIPPTPNDSEYKAGPDRPLIDSAEAPIALFKAWLEAAVVEELNDANAMSLATVDGSGIPDVRIVLLKDVGERGFSFYTHETSAKGQQLLSSSHAALCFHWKSLRRQVRIRGAVSRIPNDEADAYFASRARDSQLGAWASDQSEPLADRDDLLKELARVRAHFDEDAPVPRPSTWGGFLVAPTDIEFWQDQPYRLHDRVLFKRDEEGWTSTRLYP